MDDTEQENCRHYLENLSEYVDGTLSRELCREIEVHMAECENCRIVVDTLSKTVVLYQRVPAPELPGAAKERLYKVLDLEYFGARPRDQE
jgi:anti-sigma factor RsiW